LTKRGLTKEQIPEIHRALEKRANDYRKSIVFHSNCKNLSFELSLFIDSIRQSGGKRKKKTGKASSRIGKFSIRTQQPRGQNNHSGKISKLCVKVKAKITKVNKITKEAKKKEMDMAGAQSVEDDEDIQIHEITFQHFIDGTFPWETQAECMSMFSITIYFLVSTLI
jgi:hypothetical protein